MGKLIMVRKGNGQGMQSRPCFHPGHTLLHITNTLYSVLLFMYSTLSTVNNKTEREGVGNQVVQTLNICKQKLILLLLQLELIILMSTPHLTLSEISIQDSNLELLPDYTNDATAILFLQLFPRRKLLQGDFNVAICL